MNYFHIEGMKKKIVYVLLLFAGALLLGIGAAVAAEHIAQVRVDGRRAAEQTPVQKERGQAEQLPVQKTEPAKPPQQVRQQDEQVKKVALTFDDDVIIGLSQEISYERSGFYDLALLNFYMEGGKCLTLFLSRSNVTKITNSTSRGRKQ